MLPKLKSRGDPLLAVEFQLLKCASRESSKLRPNFRARAREGTLRVKVQECNWHRRALSGQRGHSERVRPPGELEPQQSASHIDSAKRCGPLSSARQWRTRLRARHAWQPGKMATDDCQARRSGPRNNVVCCLPGSLRARHAVESTRGTANETGTRCQRSEASLQRRPPVTVNECPGTSAEEIKAR